MHLGPAPTFAFAIGAFASLFSVINPASGAVVFAGATAELDAPTRRACARKASLTAGIAMLGFALLGQFLFSFFGFTALAMRFVGGVLVFKSAMTMLYGDPEPDRSMEAEREASGQRAEESAIIPFGIPLLAGAGTISTVMGMIVGLSVLEYLTVLASIALNAFICYLFLRHAPKVVAKLGPIGSKVLTKLMGLILAAVAAQFLINGAKELAREIHQQQALAQTAMGDRKATPDPPRLTGVSPLPTIADRRQGPDALGAEPPGGLPTPSAANPLLPPTS